MSKYFEEYGCGCVSPSAIKADLPNYCPTHGDSWQWIYKDTSVAREQLEAAQHAAKLARAQASVIRAAKEWVNYKDDGSTDALMAESAIRLRLARAVARLEKISKLYS